MTTKTTGKKVQREAQLRWVRIIDMLVTPAAQREYKAKWAEELADNLDLEQVGNPTVNERDDTFYIVDGQHRISAYKIWLGDGNWEDQQFQCWTYVGLTEQEEAEMFLKLNNKLTVSTFDKFRVAITAGRSEECDIDRIVRGLGMVISRTRAAGGIMAVGTLRKVYRLDPMTLARSLRIIRDAYGDAGLEAHMIEGFGLLCHRYNGDLNDKAATHKLANARGGLNGLVNSAEKLRQQTGSPRSHCVAAAAVAIYNRGTGVRKLPSWWREDT